MNKLIRKTIWVVALAGWCAFTAQAQTRIAVIDYKKAIAGFWKTKEAKAALDERQRDLVKELKGLGEDIKKGETEYQKISDDAKDQGVSTDEREKRKKSADAKLKSISEMKERAREFDRNASAQLNEQASRMSERIDEKIRAVIAAKAKAGGYALVLDTTSRSTDPRGLENRAIVLYSNGDNDITDSVLEQLNTDAPADAKEKKPEKK